MLTGDGFCRLCVVYETNSLNLNFSMMEAAQFRGRSHQGQKVDFCYRTSKLVFNRLVWDNFLKVFAMFAPCFSRQAPPESYLTPYTPQILLQKKILFTKKKILFRIGFPPSEGTFLWRTKFLF